jgi:large subunit ribosomal protein L23
MSALFASKNQTSKAVKRQEGESSSVSLARAIQKLRGKAARNPLIRPHLTEKANRLAQSGVYVFIVDRNATKPAIKRAIEERYRVNVVRLRIINVPRSILRRGGRILRKRPALKKALVKLEKGQKIEGIA